MIGDLAAEIFEAWDVAAPTTVPPPSEVAELLRLFPADLIIGAINEARFLGDALDRRQFRRLLKLRTQARWIRAEVA